MRVSISIAIISCLLLNNCTKKAEPGLLISQIKCSGSENPVGIGLTPDFSWILTAGHRGQIQTAYQVIVGSESEINKNDPGTIWDSGKILSLQSVWIAYQGPSLISGKEYFWRIRAWDEDDKPSPWSKTGRFVTGLFSEEDWRDSKWILAGFEMDRL